jgi:hypothetical protein
MSQLTCATCNSATLKPPRLVAGAWHALCTDCLFETEVEAVDGSDGEKAVICVQGVAGISPQQEADLRLPQAAQVG